MQNSSKKPPVAIYKQPLILPNYRAYHNNSCLASVPQGWDSNPHTTDPAWQNLAVALKALDVNSWADLGDDPFNSIVNALCLALGLQEICMYKSYDDHPDDDPTDSINVAVNSLTNMLGVYTMGVYTLGSYNTGTDTHLACFFNIPDGAVPTSVPSYMGYKRLEYLQSNQ